MKRRGLSNLHSPLLNGEENRNRGQQEESGPVASAIRSFFSRFDLMQILPMLALVTVGILFIYGTGEQALYGAGLFWKRQLVYFLAGFVLWFFLIFFDYRWLGPGGAAFYPFALTLLVLVLFTEARNGAHRWLEIGGISIQPSEFAKLAVILCVSWVLSFKRADINRPLWALLVMVIAGIPFALVFLEPDFGTSLVLLPITAAIAFAANLKIRYILILLAIVMVAVPISYRCMRPYQKERIHTFLDPERDPLNRGWNARQSEFAVGSGGIHGKGFMNGTHCMLGYLPKRVANSDFIFPVISEETGFIGSFSLLLLFGLLLFSILRTALLAPDAFGRYLCVGIGTLIAVHTVINIGMCIRLVPITGLPLPLISYGGTFLVTNMIYLGIVQSVYAHRSRESFLEV